MERQEIINGIVRELENISSERPKDFYYSIESYTDTYYEDSICALVLKWNQLGYGNFDETFPKTSKVITELELVDDFVERPREVYEGIISLAKDALKEVKEYKVS